MTVTEDELANTLIRLHREQQEKERETNPDADEVGVFPEAHYNYYGTRGVADLYLTIGDWDGTLYELKSEAALRNATGANEIIRQFNKMRENFFRGSSHTVPRKWLTYELCFTPSEATFRHLAANADLYRAVPQQILLENPPESHDIQITVRTADVERSLPLIIFKKDWDYREMDFIAYIKRTQPEIFETYESTLRDMV